jgi:D-xylose transport system ATP-binding protein
MSPAVATDAARIRSEDAERVMTAEDTIPLLEAKGVSKRFGRIHALTDVDFDLHAGEVVALVGDNGAGKSTLIKAIAGIQLADEGRFYMRGEEVHISTPSDATALGIATVYQDLALCDNLDVVANLFLGQEELVPGPGKAIRKLDETEMEERAHDLLEHLAVTIVKLRAKVGSLSGGQRQQVAIARAMLGDPAVVMLDEPTAALGIRQTAQVLGLIKRLRDDGHGVVVISHNLENVFAVADRICVLRLGRVVGSFDRATTAKADIVAAITGADAGAPAIIDMPSPASAGAATAAAR